MYKACNSDSARIKFMSDYLVAIKKKNARRIDTAYCLFAVVYSLCQRNIENRIFPVIFVTGYRIFHIRHLEVSFYSRMHGESV